MAAPAFKVRLRPRSIEGMETKCACENPTFQLYDNCKLGYRWLSHRQGTAGYSGCARSVILPSPSISADSKTGAWSSYIRQCAKRYNKSNFYIPGEIVAGNSFGAVYLGRGMEPEMAESNLTEVVASKDAKRKYIRDLDNSALDAGAFHYTVCLRLAHNCEQFQGA